MKKIIITESQLQTILLDLKESNSNDDILLYQDDNITFMLQAEAGQKNLKMGMGEDLYVFIKVYAGGNNYTVLSAKGNEEWGYRGERDLNFPKRPIKPGDSTFIAFEIDGKKKNTTGYNVSVLNVTYITGKIQKTVPLKIGWERESDEKTINYCKGFYNDTELNKAKAYWFNWLKDPITIKKFMKNWGLPQNEVLSIFNQYNNAIKAAQLEYVSEPKGNFLARVTPRNFNTLLNTAKFIPIEVNCVQHYLDGGEEKPQTVLTHEIQHLLNIIHPWQPNEKSATSKNIDANLSLLDKIVQLVKNRTTDQDKELIDRMVQDGFEEPDAQSIVRDFKQLKKNNNPYIKSENELASFITAFRQRLNLKPGQDITPEQLITNKSANQAYWLIRFYLMSGLPLTSYLSMINAYAKADIVGRKRSTDDMV